MVHQLIYHSLSTTQRLSHTFKVHNQSCFKNNSPYFRIMYIQEVMHYIDLGLL